MVDQDLQSEPDPTPHGVPITRRRIGRFRVLDVGAVVVILLVLGALALVANLREPSGSGSRSASESESASGSGSGSDSSPSDDPAVLGRAAAKVADAQVLGLTTLDRKDVETKVEALKARVADDYRDAFAAQLATFTQVALTYDGLATGKITSSTVSEVDDDQAVVAVTAETAVTKRQTPTVERTYAFTVTLDRDGDTWLVSDLALSS